MKLTTAGESHGKALVAILEGMAGKAGLKLEEGLKDTVFFYLESMGQKEREE